MKMAIAAVIFLAALNASAEDVSARFISLSCFGFTMDISPDVTFESVRDSQSTPYLVQRYLYQPKLNNRPENNLGVIERVTFDAPTGQFFVTLSSGTEVKFKQKGYGNVGNARVQNCNIRLAGGN